MDSEFDPWTSWEEDEINHLLQEMDTNSGAYNVPGNNELSEAVSRSRQEHSLRQMSLQINNKRLDKRLQANNMERIQVPADGNCFFKAASLHLNEDANSLRISLCEEMRTNINSYVEFFCTSSQSSREENMAKMLEAITAMLQNGQWNSDINDGLPQALANYTKRRVKIFTSMQKPAVINVHPTQHPHSAFNPIYLALLSPPIGIAPHYDGCVPLKQHTYSKFHPFPSQPPPPRASYADVLRSAPPSAQPLLSNRSPISPQQAQGPGVSTMPPQPPPSPGVSTMSPHTLPSPGVSNMSHKSPPSPGVSTMSPQPPTSPGVSAMSPQPPPSPGVSTLSPQPPPSPGVSTMSPQPPPSPGVSTMSPQPPPSPGVSTMSPQPPPSPGVSTMSPRPPLSPGVTSTPPPKSSGVSNRPLRSPSQRQPSLSETGIYMTPPKKTPPRKRKATPHTWQRNVRKHLKLEGKAYTTNRGKQIKAKSVQNIECKCKLKCAENVDSTQRKDIFDTFYGLGSTDRQRDFICRHVTEKPTLTYLNENKEPVIKKRQIARKYFFTVGTNNVQVCKRFFQGTLDIGHGFIDTSLKNCENGSFTGEDRRGKHSPPNKTSAESRARVKKHTESFPAVESHYCRQKCKKKFLDSTLNINRMYSLYADSCKEDGVPPVSSSLYRHIFNTEYNLDFHKPKKDLCLLCSTYLEEKRAGEVSSLKQKQYEEHMERKKESREKKARDKELSKHRKDIHCATFDLEAVLPTPSTNASQAHYLRKLAVYNLTVFSLGDKEATCYLWDETEGRKGSCEVATCLYKYICSLPKCVKHIIFFSDTCGGQNRNKFVASALNFIVKHSPNIEIIDQKFLESGHSHMECDSVHSSIEKAKRNVDIYIPDMWHPVIQRARSSSNPYTLDVLEHNHFYDFKQVARAHLRNVKVDTDGKQVNWLKIKFIRYTKDDPDTLYFKYRMTDSFRKLKIKSGSGRRQKKEIEITDLPSLYNQRQPISEAKKKDLLKMCELGIVPKKLHSYYQAIPSSTSVRDRLSEPDRCEETDSDDE